MIAIWVLAWRYLKSRAGRSLLVIIAVGGSTTLVVTLFCVSGSIASSISQFEKGIAGQADLTAVGLSDAGLSQRLISRIEETPGVARAAPLLEVPTQLRANSIENNATLLGITPSIISFFSGSGSNLFSGLPTATAAGGGLFAGTRLAEDLHAHVGSIITINVAGQSHIEKIAGEVPESVSDFNEGRFLIAPLSVAQEISGRQNWVSDVLIKLSRPSARQQVVKRLTGNLDGEAVIESQAQLVSQASIGVSTYTSAIPALSAMVALISLFLVFNSMTMIALERRRELSILRAVGAKRSSLLVGALLQAMVLGAIGTGIGVGVGAIIGRALIGRLPPVLLSSLPTAVTFALPRSAFTFATVAGVGGSLLAAALPSFRGVQVTPVEALRLQTDRESVSERPTGRWPATAISLGVMVSGVVAAYIQPTRLSVVGIGLCVLGFLMGMFTNASRLAQIGAAMVRRAGSAGTLAAATLERTPGRVWATVAAVATATTLVVGLGGVAADGSASVRSTFGSLADADIWVETAPANSLPNHVLMPTAWDRELAHIPGVASVRSGQFAYVSSGTSEILLQGTEPGTATPIVRDASAAAQREFADGRSAIISRQIADARHVHVGSKISLNTPSGRKALRVSAVVVSFIWPQGSIALPMTELESWYHRAGASWFELTTRTGASRAIVMGRVEAFVQHSNLPVYVVSGTAQLNGASSEVSELDTLLYGLAAVALGVSALAVFNTFLISVTERRREIGVLRAVGMDRRRLTQSIVLEAGQMSVMGVLLGVILGLTLQALILRIYDSAQGLAIPFRISITPIVAAVFAGCVTTAIGAWWPARKAGALQPVEAIEYE